MKNYGSLASGKLNLRVYWDRTNILLICINIYISKFDSSTMEL
jgi:hypothetical protein